MRIGPSQIAASLVGLAMVAAATISSAQDELFKSRKIAGGKSEFSGIEGPAVDKDGNLYFVHFVMKSGAKAGRISQLKPGADKAELFVELPKGSIGNGIRFDKDGRMYVADYPKHNVLVVEKGETKPYFGTKDADTPHFNQPNDVAMGNDGTVYASDPLRKTGQPLTGQIWRITRGADGTGRGELMHSQRKKMGVTNGIDLSPDGKMLYVSESTSQEVWAYRIDGAELRSEFLVKKFTHPANAELDGLRTDATGRIYVARPRNALKKGEPPCSGNADERCIGTIAILPPVENAAVVMEIRTLGKAPSNLTFGGPDGKTVFVTQSADGSIESFRVDKPGREPCMQFGGAFCPPQP